MAFIANIFPIYLPLALASASYTEFRVVLLTASAIDVDWGDGAHTSYSGTNLTISHTYSSPYTGNIKITCTAGNNKIIKLDSFSNSNTTNSIVFTTSQLSLFTGLQVLACLTSNVITGDINFLPKGMITLIVMGANNLSGNIANSPPTLTTFDIRGVNTTTGNIANLPANLQSYRNEGSNTTSGNISGLVNTLTVYNNAGSNTTTGDTVNLKSGLLIYANRGINTTTGDIGLLPSNLILYNNGGANTSYGDLSGLPNLLTNYINEGLNTTTGNVDDLPPILVQYSNGGLNTTTGNMFNLPSTITYYKNTGLSLVVNYTSGRTWANNMSVVLNQPQSGGLSTTEVDNILIDLANVATWTLLTSETSRVDLTGTNAPRSSNPTVDAAVATIQSKGVIVLTN